MTDIPQKRRYFRLPVRMQVNVFDPSGVKYSLNTHDLSAGGMNLVAEGGFPVNSYLKLQFNLEGENFPISAVGLVKWVKPLENKKWIMGVEFIKLEEAAREKIVKFINTKSLELRRRGLI